MSVDGRYVSFVSRASNLVPGDTNFVTDAYRFDRLQRRIERITLGNEGVQALENTDYTSVDGAHRRYVINCANLYNRPEPLSGDRCIKNMDSGAVTPIKPYNGINDAIGNAFFSADGQFLVYATKDPTLIPGGALGPCSINPICYRFIRENLSSGERALISVKADGGFLDADRRSLAEVSPTGNSVAFPVRIIEFYPPPAPPELVALAVWRDTTGHAEDASVVDFGIGSSGIGYQGFNFDQSGTRLLWRQLDDFIAPPDSDGQQIVYRNLDEPQGHRIIRTLSGGLTFWGHCQKPRRPVGIFNISFNCPRLSQDGKTIVFSSQDANLVPGDTNFGLPNNVDDERRQDVFIVTVTDSQPIAVPSMSLLATLVLGILLAFSGGHFAGARKY
jgi:TolB protein